MIGVATEPSSPHLSERQTVGMHSSGFVGIAGRRICSSMGDNRADAFAALGGWADNCAVVIADGHARVPAEARKASKASTGTGYASCVVPGLTLRALNRWH